MSRPLVRPSNVPWVFWLERYVATVQSAYLLKLACVSVFKPNKQNIQTFVLSKLGLYRSDFNKILYSDEHLQVVYSSTAILKKKNPRWQTAAILKTVKRDTATVWPILMKFGTMRIGLPSEMATNKLKFWKSKVTQTN